MGDFLQGFIPGVGIAGLSGGGSVGYQIDPDQIPALITRLENAVTKLDLASDLANGDPRSVVNPATADEPYSPAAVDRMGSNLADEFIRANTQHIQNVKNLINSLKAAKRQYDEAEHAGEQTFKGKHA